MLNSQKEYVELYWSKAHMCLNNGFCQYWPNFTFGKLGTLVLKINGLNWLKTQLNTALMLNI